MPLATYMSDFAQRCKVVSGWNSPLAIYYGGPEGPCPLSITMFTNITNFDFSHYQLPIYLFLVSDFEFSYY